MIVLALVDTARAKLPAAELLLGTRAGKFPVAPRPPHDLNAAAEHRMNLAVRHLKTIGCQASGLLSEEELVKAVRAETRRHDYDEVYPGDRQAKGFQTGSRGGPGPGSEAAATVGPTADRVPEWSRSKLSPAREHTVWGSSSCAGDPASRPVVEDARMTSETGSVAKSGQESVVLASFDSYRRAEHMLASLGGSSAGRPARAARGLWWSGATPTGR